MKFLSLIAIAFICYAVVNAWKRPGLFAAVVINSYLYSIYFGSLGVVASVCGILVAASALLDKRRTFAPMAPAEWWLLAWLTMSLLTIFASWQINASLLYAGELLLFFLANYGMGRAFGEREDFVRDVLIGSLLTILICEPTIMTSREQSLGRLTGDLSAVGASLVIDIPMVGLTALIFFNRSLGRWARIGLTSLLVFGILPLALALGTRSVILGFLAMVTVYTIYLIRLKGAAVILARVVAVIAAVAAVMASIWYYLQDTLIGKILAFGGSRLVMNFGSSGHVVIDSSTAERIGAIEQSLELIAEAPTFGHGLGSFQYLSDGGLSYPHNMFLELLVSIGVVGLILFLLGVVPLAARMFRAAARQPLAWQDLFILGLFIDMLIRMQVSMSFVMGKTLFLSLGMIAAKGQFSGRDHPVVRGELLDDGPAQVNA